MHVGEKSGEVVVAYHVSGGGLTSGDFDAAVVDGSEGGVVVSGKEEDVPGMCMRADELGVAELELSWVGECDVVFEDDDVGPLVLDGVLESENVALSASGGAIVGAVYGVDS